MEDAAHAVVRDSDSEDLNTSFKSQDTTHRRTVSEWMILSCVCVPDRVFEE